MSISPIILYPHGGTVPFMQQKDSSGGEHCSRKCCQLSDPVAGYCDCRRVGGKKGIINE